MTYNGMLEECTTAVGKVPLPSSCELAVALSVAHSKVLSPGIRHHKHQVQAQAIEGFWTWTISMSVNPKTHSDQSLHIDTMSFEGI